MRIIPLLLLGALASSAQTPSTATSPRPAHVQKKVAAVLQAENFNRESAAAVVDQIAEGMRALSARTVLSVFDRGQEDLFTQVKEQSSLWFERSREIRIHYTLQEWSAQNGSAQVSARFQVEQYSASEEQEPVRRDTVLRLELHKTKSGWRVTQYSPQDFFLP